LKVNEMDRIELVITEAWNKAYPGAHAGLLGLSGVANPEMSAALEHEKADLEGALRSRFDGYERVKLRSLPVLQAYHEYYRRFDKTYHVQLQLESLVLKGRDIPRQAALVQCMFMAELKNLLLTAAHDGDRLAYPLRLDIATGEEVYTQLNGHEQTLKSGDMYIADGEGVISSVIYGPDQRTRLRPETRRAVFTVYAPAGIAEAAVQEHLQDIARFVRLVSPQAEVEILEVFGD
jgi:DNA/RNA-binding domain of Phe-tRNA-synthetase-like protein